MCKPTLLKPVLLLLVLLSLCGQRSYAGSAYKNEPAYFLQHLQHPHPLADSGAGAVVLYEKNSVLIKFGLMGYLYRATEVHRVVHILKKSSLGQAEINIMALSTDERKGEITGISCVTYNLEGGALEQQQLDKDAIHWTKTEYAVQAKFSAPSVREGTIIDYTYRVIEDFTSILLVDWNFQNGLPKVYSELEVIMPNNLEPVVLSNRNPKFQPFDDRRQGLKETDFPENYSSEDLLDAKAFRQFRWVRRNVPRIYEEPFMAALDNFTANIQLQLTAVHGAYGSEKIMSSWDQVNGTLMQSANFYKVIENRGSGVKERTALVTAGKSTPLGKAHAIFSYVRDHIRVTDGAPVLAYQSMEKVLKEKSGSVAETNLLLTSMLQEAGLKSQPLILSTRDRIRPYKVYPMLNQFNRTVATLQIGTDTYYLDASRRYNAFGALPAECYNGFAWKVDKNGSGIDLDPQLLQEKKAIEIHTEKADPADYQLGFRLAFGQMSGSQKRTAWKTDSLEIKKYIQSVVKQLPYDAKLLRYQILNLDQADSVLEARFSVALQWPAGESTIYINPVMVAHVLQNPFRAGERKYPVEMPCAVEYDYTCHLQLPPGYKLEEKPESSAIELDEKDNYSYLIKYQPETGMVDINTKLKMPRTTFTTDEYSWLRSFFDSVVESQQQQIIIKKKA